VVSANATFSDVFAESIQFQLLLDQMINTCHWVIICDDVDIETEEWDDDALSVEECLFCPHVSNSLEKNVKHMTVEHSFFIPDIEYLVDLEGFMSYLGKGNSVSFLALLFEQILYLHICFVLHCQELCITLYQGCREKDFNRTVFSTCLFVCLFVCWLFDKTKLIN
jgi:Zn ribbon nucleic-acid-binding protein